MPLRTQQRQRQRDTIRGFLGVNLRRDPLTLADGDVVRAINADMHRRPGVAMMRLGSSQRFPTSLGATIRHIAKHNITRYEIAGGTLFVNEVNRFAGMLASPVPSIQPFRRLNDTADFIYIAAGNSMAKYDPVADSITNWGVTAPTIAPVAILTSGPGASSGIYTFVYTYAEFLDGVLIVESNPSPTSNSVDSAGGVFVDVSVTASTEASITHINIYRTADGGATHLFLFTVANTTATVNGGTTALDSALGIAVETDNNRPNNMSWVREFQGHLFCTRDPLNPHYIWWSKRFRDAVPSDNFLEIGTPSDPIQCAHPIAGFMGVFTLLTKYRVAGNTTSGFIALEALSSRGTPAPQATLVTSRGVVFAARDGIFLTNFLQEDTELSQEIESLFHGETVNGYAPIDWTRSDDMAMAEYKGRLYWSYPTVGGGSLMAVFSRDTGKWYFYDYPDAYSALYFEEDTDLLIAGSTSGLIAILEDVTADGTADTPTLSLTPASRAGLDSDLLKYFQYLRVDVTAPTSQVVVTIVIDGVVRHEVTVTGNRTRQLLRLPGRILGRVWSLQFTATSMDAVDVHGATMQYVPLLDA